MRFEEGQEIWVVPIRFWEVSEYEPTRGVVVEPAAEGDRHVYAFGDQYGHNVYYQADRCFPTEFAARAEQLRLASVKRVADACEWDRHWNEVLEPMFERGASFGEFLEALIAD